ncbi:MAG TPA: hypothetical protein VN970_03245, partial [Thermoanaerobaculia bacterium]|nr:hypothetical protein [Thermoanaerobaculia bacterium]
GETTLHPQLLDLLDAVLDRPVGRVLLNSNGIAIAHDDRLVAYLEKHHKRIEVYLQFDGFRVETHRHHRGADLRRIKTRAVERLSAAGVFTTLTMTAALGVSPALVAALFALAGLRAYAGAWRAGLRKSDCVLVDPRLVMLYLASVALAGLAWTALRVAILLHLVTRAAH